MNAKEKAAKLKKLDRQIADLEAKLGGLREERAKLELEPGQAAPETGLDLLWNAALPMSRSRSSRHQCRVEWHRIPKAQRPKIETAVEALKAWNKSEQWTKDANAYAKGLHIFIKHRMWEDLPQVRDPLSRYRPTKPVAAPLPGGEEITPDDVSAILAGFTKPFRNPDEIQP